MKKEIPFSEGKVVFFKEADFWSELLGMCNEETEDICIATYNFNFRDQYEKSFYKHLSRLANLGVNINLLYSKMTFSEEERFALEEVFKNFVMCAELKSNHSKLFLTDDIAYIGSANFSFSSNNNYESGVIFTNKDIILEIRKYFFEELIDKSEFTNVPESFDPFDFLPNIISSVEKLHETEIGDLYGKVKHNMTELRFLDGMEKDLETLGYPVPITFDWWNLYERLYKEEHVPETVLSDFKDYVNTLLPYLYKLKSIIREYYQTSGRVQLLEKIGLIKNSGDGGF